MGNPFLLQACLKLNTSEIPSELELGKEYAFSKEEHRLYQINVPMDLRDENWNFLCRVVVTEFTIGKGKTNGKYVPVKFFTNEERDVITKTYTSDQDVKQIVK